MRGSLNLFSYTGGLMWHSNVNWGQSHLRDVQSPQHILHWAAVDKQASVSPGCFLCPVRPALLLTVSLNDLTQEQMQHQSGGGCLWAASHLHINSINQTLSQEPLVVISNWIKSLWRCTILDAWGWCTGMTQRDGIGREEGGGFRMGNTCIPVADSFWYLAKLIQLCKV